LGQVWALLLGICTRYESMRDPTSMMKGVQATRISERWVFPTEANTENNRTMAAARPMTERVLSVSQLIRRGFSGASGIPAVAVAARLSVYQASSSAALLYTEGL